MLKKLSAALALLAFVGLAHGAGEYYNHSSFPATGSAATSAGMRAEFDLVEGGFDKLPTLAGNANKVCKVNSSATGLGLGIITDDGSTVTIGGGLIVSGSLVLTNPLSITDSNFSIKGNIDATKLLKFEVDGFTTATTRTVTMPNADITVMGVDTTQTPTNKNISFGSNTITGTTTQFNAALTDNDFATQAGIEPLSNKTIGNSNTINVFDTLFAIQDDSDATKQFRIQTSGISAGTVRTMTVPNVNFTPAIAGANTDITSLNSPDIGSATAITQPPGDSSNRVATTYFVASSAANPPGTVIDFAGSSAPTGYLLCDGSAVSRTTYASLFAAIGTTWGAGNGSTTFNLPDLRGRTTIGAGAGSGLTARTLGTQNIGEENHLLTTAEMPSHSHGVTDPGHTHNTNAGTNGSFGSAGSGVPLFGSSVSSSSVTGITIQSSGSGGTHNVMQPSAVLNKFIKY